MKKGSISFLACWFVGIGLINIAFAQPDGLSTKNTGIEKKLCGSIQVSQPVQMKDLIVPYSFHWVGRGEQDTSRSIGQEPGLVPDQFTTKQEISVREQQWLLEKKANETLYREQSDPLYFEKSETLFKQEFSKRMKAKQK